MRKDIRRWQEEIQQLKREKENLRTLFYQFVPPQIADRLCLDHTEIHGDYMELEGILIYVRKKSGQVPDRWFYERLLPALNSLPGVICELREQACFVVAENSAGVSAAEVFRVALDQQIIPDSQTGPELFWGISTGTVRVQLCGSPERKTIQIASTEKSIASHLCLLAEKYRVRVLAAAMAAEEVNCFEQRFCARPFGQAEVMDQTGTEHVVEVLELYDGTYRARYRDMTKCFFERGIELYQKECYREARKYFLEVLKADRYDRVAGAYIQLCEQKKQMVLE